MGRRKGRGWISRVSGVIVSLTALLFARTSVSAAETGDTQKPTCQPRKGAVREKYLMVVSTLDGRVSALDIHNHGELVWSVQADSRPLLSSSISSMEVTSEGRRIRLVPSLDGGLYQYDGKGIEAVPMTAETLLSSSFRLSDNTIMVGGRDIRTYGIDANNGQIRYLCTMSGCKYLGESEVSSEEDLIVLTRNTQTVRAVDAKLGQEKWNFSVGRHELELLDSSRPGIPDEIDDEEGVSVVTCNPSDEEIAEAEREQDQEGLLKVIVPEGMVVSLSPSDQSAVVWKHKFPSPVANAWMLRSGQLKLLNLFDSRHVPALSSFQPEDEEGVRRDPLLYVGKHGNQLYVQPAQHMQKHMDAAGGPLRVSWKPYLNTASSRTPIMRNSPAGVPLIGQDPTVDDMEQTSLTVWHENYPFDNGYYLYPDTSPRPEIGMTPAKGAQDGGSDTTVNIPATLWNWWKQVVVISLLTSIIVHLFLTRYAHKEILQNATSQQKSKESSENSTNMRGSDSSSDILGAQNSSEYVSRFSADFDCLHCLGKGGFGIVFEARNKMDECHYAVKRICIPNNNGAKERVRREVKALAKLEHIGIVRFYHAWLESPPVGWQEERDKQFEDSECLTPTPCNSGADISSASKLLPNQAMEASLTDPNLEGNKMNFFIQQGRTWKEKCNSLREECTAEFSAHSTQDISTDESGSFSFPGGTPDCEDDDSCSIVFRKTDTDSNNDQSNSCNIPFQEYQKESINGLNRNVNEDSFSIVFEDSGCKDKSSNGDGSQDLKEGSSAHKSGDIFREKSITDEKSSSQFEASGGNQMQESLPIVPNHSSIDSPKKTVTPKLYLYIQMQLCRRETLKDWLNANTLNRDRQSVLDMFDQIVCTVEYVHDCGLMHRDLKPSNIFFSGDGTIKVGDFGLVTALAEQQDITNETGNNFAKHTAEVGTQLYMSPEQIAKKPYDHKVDIFSLGMVLFELLYPFSTQMERIRTLVDAKKQIFPERFKKEMPNECTFVSWLLSPNPVDRPSAKNILDSDLLKDFVSRRMPDRFRNRTISGDSNSSS